MSLSNIDTVKIVGKSGGGPQITMQHKLTPDPECKAIVFESIPNNVTWGQVSRCNVPGGAVLPCQLFSGLEICHATL